MTKDTETIVKVQLAIIGGTGVNRGLVYAEGRKCMSEQELPERVIKALQRFPKGFFKATWGGKEAGWTVGDKVPDQNW